MFADSTNDMFVRDVTSSPALLPILGFIAIVVMFVTLLVVVLLRTRRAG